MGGYGPIPKRSEERRRRNAPEGPEVIRLPSGPPSDVPETPPPSEGWHPIATGWYLALRESGQAALYQPSDWAKARYVAELMSRSLQQSTPSGYLITVLRGAMAGLLATEGDRRRAGVELSRH